MSSKILWIIDPGNKITVARAVHKRACANFSIKSQIENIQSQPLIKSVVAVDVGYVNLGFVHLSNSNPYNILDWGLINPGVYNDFNDIEMPSTGYDVFKYCQITKSSIIPMLYKENAIYLIEKQHLRPLGTFGKIPQTVIRNVAFEAIV